MSVSAHLSAVAGECYVRDAERDRINRSLAAIQTRLRSHFGALVSQSLAFGSFSRGTILPRAADVTSDVDLMVVFANDSHRPQTYLNWLRGFVTANYSRSEVRQANPTIQLEMQHIRVELVPAVRSIFGDLHIPAKASDYEDWLVTNPTSFNSALTTANQNNNNLIKPLVRVLKRWNATRGHPIESFGLEKMIVDSAPGSWTPHRNLADALFDTVPEIGVPFFSPQWKSEAVSKLRSDVQQAKQEVRLGYEVSARQRLERLIPRL